ncbi:AAA family ATPase [Marinactinospora thermotolerans]|uniref:AAA family ATPase n=1 Tax=Marinactinospora thermotolerans TaxID=531310 RepID=UPI003D8A7537
MPSRQHGEYGRTSMDISPALLASIRAAAEAAPDNVELRVHLGELLLTSGDTAAAITEAGRALMVDPHSEQARSLMARALDVPPPPASPAPSGTGPLSSGSDRAAPEEPPAPSAGFDWAAAEEEVRGIAEPRFRSPSPGDPVLPVHDVERPTLTLADVGGMEHVKQRLEAAFLAPMRNPELRRLYAKSMRGGLLLYGPPGCGKTFLARALAGELGAHFLSVGISDVLDMWVGSSERNISAFFDQARRTAPCVLFIDELDALGRRRGASSGPGSTVHQLLTELDAVDRDNEGLFVLAATNQPWDVDPALRRPGRFDRTVLVLPPDAPARRAILEYHLRDRPIEGIDLANLVERTDGFSGADLAHVCDTAAERALVDSAHSGEVRMVNMADFEAALGDVRPSTGPWFDAARGVALFANEGGAYDDLVAYLRGRGRG